MGVTEPCFPSFLQSWQFYVDSFHILNLWVWLHCKKGSMAVSLPGLQYQRTTKEETEHNRNLFSHSPGGQSLKSRCHQGQIPSEGAREGPIPGLPSSFSWIFSLWWCYIQPSRDVLPMGMSVSKFPFSKDIRHWIRSSYYCIKLLTDFIFSDSVFK